MSNETQVQLTNKIIYGELATMMELNVDDLAAVWAAGAAVLKSGDGLVPWQGVMKRSITRI